MRESLVFFVGAAVSASACFALTDDLGGVHGPTTSSDAGLDADSSSVDAAPRANDDFTISFNGMNQHVDQRFELAVIDDSDSSNRVQTRGIIAPLKMTPAKGQFTISVPQAIPKRSGPYRVDIWADFTNNGTYDFDHLYDSPSRESFRNDHSWRVSLDDKAIPDSWQVVTHANGRYAVAFLHHLEFVDLNEFPDRQLPKKPPRNGAGADAFVHIRHLSDKPRKMVQIRISDPATFGHVVGFYRTDSSVQMDLTIPGCVDPGNRYDVALYVDDNNNNDGNGSGYDDPSKNPGNDLGWVQTVIAKATGLDVTFDAADTVNGNVDVGAP